MNSFLMRVGPWGVGLVLVAILAGTGRTPRQTSGKMDLSTFGQLPVVDRGRLKPMDTLARNVLMVVSGGYTSYDDPKTGERQPAVRWLLETMTSRLLDHRQADEIQCFRIENDQVLQLLGLERRKGLRYSLTEIAPKIEELAEQAEQARKTEPATRDIYQVKLLELAEHLQLAIMVAKMETPLLIPPATKEESWTTLIGAARRAVAAGKENPEADDPAVKGIVGLLKAYAAGDDSAFNLALGEYRQVVAERVGSEEMKRASFETTFNEVQPFYYGMYFYLTAFVLTMIGWIFADKPFGKFSNTTALAIVAFTFLFHTASLASRMYIQNRPPVTNLYSSAVFIGWGCVGLALLVERIIGMGVGNAVGAITGGFSLIIANFLASGGDTLEMMQAVLDTNFWLATHVTCITLGYTASFVAGFLGVGYILWGMGTPTMTKAGGKALSKVTYGVICFATLLSFVGTVLGGIWADQSWGRFWGWDPKENGAILIVVWNALILHARWGGLIKDRGIAILAVVGNMVTAWSWFGTNQLGVGLHAYGFNNTLASALAIFWVSQMAIVSVALLPPQFWWSVRAQALVESSLTPPASPERLLAAKKGRRNSAPGQA